MAATVITPGIRIWKTVPSLPGVEASCLGEIMSDTRPGGGQRIVRRILKGDLHETGYMAVKIAGKRYYIHRLVCEAFHGVPAIDGATVDHLDGDRLNNTADNLEWVTRHENTRRQNLDGRGVPKGELHPLAKLSNADALSVPLLVSRGHSIAEIAARLGVSRSLIHKILKGERRVHA